MMAQRHTYESEGSYDVTVKRVEGGVTRLLSYSVIIAEPSDCPLSGISGPQYVTVSEPVSYRLCGAEGQSQDSMEWDFGDGAVTTAPGDVARHAYQRGGAFTIFAGATSQSSSTQRWFLRPVSVSDCREFDFAQGNGVDIAGFLSPYFDVSLTLCHAYNTAALPESRTFQWSFGDGSQTEANPGSDVVSHWYTQPGTFAVSVTVTSFFQQDTPPLVQSYTSSLQLADENPLCPQQMLITPASHSQPVGGSLQFSPCPDLEQGYSALTWLFGDGQGSTSTQLVANHSYQSPGFYHVALQLIYGSAVITHYSVVTVPFCPFPPARDSSVTILGPLIVGQAVALFLCPGANDTALQRALTSSAGLRWYLSDGAISQEASFLLGFEHTFLSEGLQTAYVLVNAQPSPLNYSLQFRITLEDPSEDSGITAEAIVGILFSIISGLALIAGLVFLGYKYIKDHSGKAFSVERPSSDYFLMRNEGEEESDLDDDGDDHDGE